mgnify:CR=1 FL=1
MFLSSERGKRVLNFLYSWGASIVILGALFKLLHIPYANQILFVAMITESIVFFISAFEHPNKEYHWEDVFPVLKSKNPMVEYKDGLRYIYFNTTGKKGGSPAIQELLQYFQNSTETNARSERLQRIHEHVKKVKVLPEVREEFMRLDDIIYYEREEADQNRAVQDILELLEDCGEVSEELKNKIKVQTDKETLRRWHKLAARAESLEEFEAKM